MFLKEISLMLLITITIVEGGYWYSAQLFNPDSTSILNSIYKPDKEHDHNIKFAEDENKSRKNQWWTRNITTQSLLLTPTIHNLTENMVLNNSSVIYNAIAQKAFRFDNKQLNWKNFSNNETSSENEVISERIKQRRCPTLRSKRIEQSTDNTTSKSRFLDVFEVVEFQHAPCNSTIGLDGTCLHEYDCQSVGGSPMGVCADGYGTCCVLAFSCYGQTSAAVSWFTNPEFPSPSVNRLSCVLTLNKTSHYIEQIRLDFVSFELLPPTDGTCEQDQFVVSGQNTNNVVPILCGINTGQHLYIEVSDAEGPVRLTIQTVAAESRLFSIKVTQLTRSDILAAPAGCLQYFSEPHGHIESYNYKNFSEITNAIHPSYLNNLNYAICIKRDKSSCSITYANENHMEIVNYDIDGLPLIPPRQAGVEIFNCPSDWLLISAVRLCGERLNDGSVIQDFYLDAPVTDIGAGPIVIWFKSDEGNVGRGFKLHFQQNSCA